MFNPNQYHKILNEIGRRKRERGEEEGEGEGVNRKIFSLSKISMMPILIVENTNEQHIRQLILS